MISLRHAAALVALLPLAARAARAQDRLLGFRALGIAPVAEVVRFEGDGLMQPAFAGLDSLRIRRVEQFTVPVSLSVPVGELWSVDVTSVYASGRVVYSPARSAVTRTASLSGVSDVRVRATGRLAGDALVLTLGANAPSGQTKLDQEEFTAARVLAAPALGLGAPPVGAGGSATLGLLSARRIGAWAIAGGVSYERHAQYAPIGALVAGASTTNFRPGDVVHVSVGSDGLVGRQRLSLTVGVDVFGTDRLRPSAASATTPTFARVQLGPVVSSDAQLSLAVPRVREAVLWASNRWRSRFSRDDITVEGSSGTYVDGGFRTRLPATRRTDVLLAVDGRYQSGLSFDDALITARATSGGLTLGVAQRFGNLTLQPFARGQIGQVNSGRGATASMAGGSLGLTLLTRF